MQFSSILVALAGDVRNTAVKHGVSVPEVLVLMACHGADAVTLIPDTVNEDRGDAPAVEMARLVRVYGEEPVEGCFGKATFNTRLPSRFSEVGIGEPEEIQDRAPQESAADKKRRKAAEKAMAALAEGAKAPVADGISDAFPPVPGAGDDSDDDDNTPAE